MRTKTTRLLTALVALATEATSSCSQSREAAGRGGPVTSKADATVPPPADAGQASRPVDAPVPKRSRRRAAAPRPTLKSFEGTVANLHVWMDLDMRDDDRLVGSYSYFKHGKELSLVGEMKGVRTTLTESVGRVVTGGFDLEYFPAPEPGEQTLTGTWWKSGEQRELPVSLRRIEPTFKPCVALDPTQFKVGGSNLPEVVLKANPPQPPPGAERPVEVDAGRPDPSYRPYQITSCSAGLFSVKFTIGYRTADQTPHFYWDMLTFDRASKRLIRLEEELKDQALPRIKGFVTKVFADEMVKLRRRMEGSSADRVWAEMLSRAPLRFYLEKDTLYVGYVARLGLSREDAAARRLPEELSLVAIPRPLLDECLEKDSPLRRLLEEP